MAAIYNSQGKEEDAVAMYRKYLRICIRKHRPDHPSVAIPYNNMARLYKRCCSVRASTRRALLTKVKLLKKLEGMKRRS